MTAPPATKSAALSPVALDVRRPASQQIDRRPDGPSVLRIAILETGAPPLELARRHGDYPAMIERMLAPHLPGATFVRRRVFEGEAPISLSETDALIITGSPAGVYEGHSWIAPLEAHLRDAAAAGRPAVGICFGHQLMAQAFGGKVEKSDRGWGVGVHNYAVAAAEDWMRPALSRVSCAVSHQDQVTVPPPGARILAGSDFCPFGAIAYAQGPALSFQMHPEFDHGFAAELLRAREGRISRSVIDSGLDTLSAKSDRALIANWIANFLTRT